MFFQDIDIKFGFGLKPETRKGKVWATVIGTEDQCQDQSEASSLLFRLSTSTNGEVVVGT